MSCELFGEALDQAPEGAWLVRPCEEYNEEYRECTKWRSRFHQYFIFGKMLDCSEWKTDYRNCMAVRQTRDPQAVERVVASERSRMMKRLGPHYNNSVWENRDQPPADWNAPLPENLRERNKESWLYMMAEEIKQRQKDAASSAAGSSSEASSDDTSSLNSAS